MAANENNPWGAPREQNDFPTAVVTNAGKNNTVRVLGTVVVLLLLAIAAATGWLLSNGGLPGGGSSNAAWGPSEEALTVTPPAATDSGEASQMIGEPERVPSTHSEVSAADRDANRLSEAPAPAPQPGAIPAAAQADGVNERGWASNGAVNCASGEELIYAARGSDAWVTVCESGSGAMTYRSDIFGGTLTAPVMPGASNPASGRFMVDASPAVINVQGAGLIVEQDGQVISRAALPVAWVFS
ncbi:hypothetical protein [Corynebacterium sp. A21]|uniref:hypothetical protein n=1 Tax=Corynebacterium sp. A21 TaxID=3457318 RepID=UPI003FD2870F